MNTRPLSADGSLVTLFGDAYLCYTYATISQEEKGMVHTQTYAYTNSNKTIQLS